LVMRMSVSSYFSNKNKREKKEKKSLMGLIRDRTLTIIRITYLILRT